MILNHVLSIILRIHVYRGTEEVVSKVSRMSLDDDSNGSDDEPKVKPKPKQPVKVNI